MTVPLVGEYSGVVPNPNTQSAEDFSVNAIDWTSYQANTLGPDINLAISQFNIDFQTVNQNSQDAQEAAEAANLSELSAASSANFKGRWSDATGAATVPSSYENNGRVWQLLQNIPDITADEPAEGAANWLLIDSVNMSNVRVSKVDNPLTHLFKKNKLVDTLSGTLSVSNSSSSRTVINQYGEVVLVGVDEPRQSSDGWHTEGGSTNLYLYSQKFDEANWTQANKTVTAAPSENFGILTPYSVVPDAVNQIHSFQQAISPAAGSLTLTYIIKANGYGIVLFASPLAFSPTLGAQSCKIDFRDGTVLDGSQYVVQLKALKDGYWLFSHTFEVEIATTATPVLQLFSNSNQQTWTPNGVDGFYIAAAQSEQLPFPTSYIPTTTAAETRLPDKYTTAYRGNVPAPDSDWSIFVKIREVPKAESGSFPRVFDTDLGGATTDRLRCSFDDSGDGLILQNGGITVNTSTGRNAECLLFTFESNSGRLSAYIDGSLEATSSTGAPSSVIATSFIIGQSHNDQQHIYAAFNDMRIYDFVLNSDEARYLR